MLSNESVVDDDEDEHTEDASTPSNESEMITLSDSSGDLSELLSYKLVGDSIDKTTKHRYMRLDKHNKQECMHYFQVYAVKDRINFRTLSNTFPLTDSLPSSDHIVKTLLPSIDDDKEIKSNMITLMSRVIVDNIEFFNTSFDGIVDWHIPHPFQSKMSKKSEVVK